MNKYNLSIEEERDFWKTKVLVDWIKPNYKCSACNQLSLKLKKIKSIANPYKYQCNKAKCRKIFNIRNNTVFQYFPNTPMLLLIQSLELLIVERKNATNTYTYINEKFHLITAGQKNIYCFFKIIRKCMFHYYQKQ